MDTIESLARRHHRVLTTTELLRAGVSEAEIARERRLGRLVRLLRGAYAVPPLSESSEIVMARAAASRYPLAAVSCESALALHGCPVPFPVDVHMTGPLPRPDGTPSVVVHATRLPIAVTSVSAIPVTSPGLALLGAWADLHSVGDRRAIVCAALVHRTTTTQEVVELNPSARRTPAARELLRTCGYVDLGCESPLEIDYYLEVEIAYRLPPPTGRQISIELPGGRRRRVDVLYREARLIIEIDGAHHQIDEATRRRDESTDAILTTMGWRVRRFTRVDILGRPRWVAAQIRAELLAAA